MSDGVKLTLPVSVFGISWTGNPGFDVAAEIGSGLAATLAIRLDGEMRDLPLKLRKMANSVVTAKDEMRELIRHDAAHIWPSQYGNFFRGLRLPSARP